jgi:hypothetical protein
MLQCFRRYYMTIKTPPCTSVHLCSSRSINITWTRHNVTYNAPFSLVLKWPAVKLVTFLYCFYQHKSYSDWSVFLSPDDVTLDGIPHRRKYTICFCTHHHWMDVDNPYEIFQSTQIFEMVMPKLCLQKYAAYGYRHLTALRSRKSTFAVVGFVKIRKKTVKKCR